MSTFIFTQSSGSFGGLGQDNVVPYVNNVDVPANLLTMYLIYGQFKLVGLEEN